MQAGYGRQRAERVGIIKLRLVLAYAGAGAAFFVPCTWALIALCIASFAVRTFGWEAGHHRYFAHRSYKTSRAFQCVLACLGASSGQRGPIWWAVQHRQHHRHADTPRDPHTPIGNGRWYAYLGWVVNPDNCDTDLDAAKDLSRYPELVWINRYHYLLPYGVLAAVALLGYAMPTMFVGAAAAVVWGFFVPTVLSLNGSLLVNTFAHGARPNAFAYRSFETEDTSLNHWLLCLLTMGASWHNNHHRYMNAARTGFFWWELDLSYWMLRALEKIGLVWDLHEVPAQVLDEARQARAKKRAPIEPQRVLLAVDTAFDHATASLDIGGLTLNGGAAATPKPPTAPSPPSHAPSPNA